MPNVGAPVRIDIAPTNEPMMTGEPGRTSCVRAMPARVSARISDMQPAVVTGPPGEEIYPDKHGRVKVQFFWDREGKREVERVMKTRHR